MPLNTTDAGGRLIFTVFGAIAEFEREIIRERTRAGLDAALFAQVDCRIEINASAFEVTIELLVASRVAEAAVSTLGKLTLEDCCA